MGGENLGEHGDGAELEIERGPESFDVDENLDGFEDVMMGGDDDDDDDAAAAAAAAVVVAVVAAVVVVVVCWPVVVVVVVVLVLVVVRVPLRDRLAAQRERQASVLTVEVEAVVEEAQRCRRPWWFVLRIPYFWRRWLELGRGGRGHEHSTARHGDGGRN